MGIDLNDDVSDIVQLDEFKRDLEKRYVMLRNMMEVDKVAYREAIKAGRDPCDGFRVVEGSDGKLIIISCGKQGDENAQRILNKLADSNKWNFVRRTAPRATVDDLKHEIEEKFAAIIRERVSKSESVTIENNQKRAQKKGLETWVDNFSRSLEGKPQAAKP